MHLEVGTGHDSGIRGPHFESARSNQNRPRAFATAPCGCSPRGAPLPGWWTARGARGRGPGGAARPGAPWAAGSPARRHRARRGLRGPGRPLSLFGFGGGRATCLRSSRSRGVRIGRVPWKLEPLEQLTSGQCRSEVHLETFRNKSWRLSGKYSG